MSMSDSTGRTTGTRRTWIIAGSAVGFLVLLLLALTFTVFIPQGVTSDGNKQEANLNAWYADAVADLHNCTAKTARAAQVTKGQTEAVNKVLKDAVAGRYGTGNNLDEGKLFSAIHEAYPEQSVAGLNKSFQDAMAIMTGCQDDFTAAQKVVQSKVADFKSWRTGSWTVRTFGGNNFPNDNLEINLAGMDHLTGTRALTLMSRPIVDTDTVNAVKEGVDNSFKEDPFAVPTPSPTR
jgi:hypothetical protein